METIETATSDQSALPGIEPQQSNGENIKSIASAALGRQQIKRGRGRPRKDGSAPRPAVPGENGNSVVGIEKQITKEYTVDVKLVEKVVSSGLTAIDGWVVRSIKARARLCGADARTMEEIGASVAMAGEERATISELFGVLAQKYGLLGKFAPEMMLAVVVGGYAFRVGLSYSQTSAMLADAKRLKSATT